MLILQNAINGLCINKLRVYFNFEYTRNCFFCELKCSSLGMA